ncbi:DUF3089 domain-containing protein [Sphingomonas sp.]|uniref:DUF3089 domain-containing protein n=1 Tax=Sphingomonas sp. TaxID=28214 RepID=UPI00325FC9D6
MSFALILAVVAMPSLPADNDYQLGRNWLCLPGRRDACAVDQRVTRVSVDGALTVEPGPRPAHPAADCFYIYPTASLDPGPISDMVASSDETDRITSQFARFASVCRPFAPLYRQVTLTALRARLRGEKVDWNEERGYRDVRDAWRNYLAHDNRGRPFVLVGHSQGANVLKRLIAEEIDGKPIQHRLLSAILPGTSLLVPRGKDVGGDFKSIRLCRAASQTGCAIVWASYRDTIPPPANALFGVSRDPAMEAACTNPARLEGGSAPLDALLGFPWWRGGVAQGVMPKASWQVDGRPVPTRFARVPGRLSGECVRGAHANYLAVHVNTDPKTPFDRELTDEPVIGDNAYPDWGFHVVDMAIVHGDLLRLVKTQSAAWRAHRR